VVWKKTNGKCYYCGIKLTDPKNRKNAHSSPEPSEFHVDHQHPRIMGGIETNENLVPACMTCNAIKGKKTVEEFRAYLELLSFAKRHGIWFSADQVKWITDRGLIMDISHHVFWFESNPEVE